MVADRDVGIVQTNDLPNTLTLLKTGAIQAGVLVAPVTLQARKMGFPELVDMTKIGGSFPFNGVVTMRECSGLSPWAWSSVETRIQMPTDLDGGFIGLDQ